jgi:hypothetical protein
MDNYLPLTSSANEAQIKWLSDALDQLQREIQALNERIKLIETSLGKECIEKWKQHLKEKESRK